ncbi:Protein HOTHEAD [Quillaja saponaria]|uniref:Protein HOTHEAD n=1 Tax=Quillaja saponaria TaxID=32244 RepID=A0AAD7L6A5_QUISA|nr:Protein HOTHEAD [Quillaja saponaria]
MSICMTACVWGTLGPRDITPGIIQYWRIIVKWYCIVVNSASPWLWLKQTNSFFAWLLNILSPCQGLQDYHDKYPFIRKASSFSSSASFLTNGNNNAYDYIIVGGGTAGCPLAATLPQNFSVLLLERGGVPFTNPNVSFLENFHITLADTSSTSASQEFISTDGVLNARARVLGGGSSINAGFYTRASKRFIEKFGWEAKLVNESYQWVEKQIVHRPQLSPWQRALRDSLLDVGISPFNGFTYDHIYGTKVGGTIFDRFGRRHTAAELLASGNPHKLTVMIHATVLKVVFDTTGKRPKAVGVMFKDENGKKVQAILANKRQSEVILSTGAIGAPQVLLLSGIGPKAELKKLNISVVLDNKFVGTGMADNPMNAILFLPIGQLSSLSYKLLGFPSWVYTLSLAVGLDSPVTAFAATMVSCQPRLGSCPPFLQTKDHHKLYRLT